MSEEDLIKHLNKFKSRRGPYLLEVECANGYAGVRVRDRQLAFLLAETAGRTGTAKYIRLFFHSPRRGEGDEKILIDYPDHSRLWEPSQKKVISELKNCRRSGLTCQTNRTST